MTNAIAGLGRRIWSAEHMFRLAWQSARMQKMAWHMDDASLPARFLPRKAGKPQGVGKNGQSTSWRNLGAWPAFASDSGISGRPRFRVNLPMAPNVQARKCQQSHAESDSMPLQTNANINGTRIRCSVYHSTGVEPRLISFGEGPRKKIIHP